MKQKLHLQESTLGHIYVLIATILIAGSFQASANLAGSVDSISLTLYRFVLALLILLPFIIYKKSRIINSIKIFPKATIVSLFYSLYFIGMFKALETTTPLNSGALYTLTPLMTAILCIFIFKEKIPTKQLLVYIIGIVSTSIVVFRADFELFLNLKLNNGDIIFLLASLSMAFYPIFLKLLYSKDDEVLVTVFSTLLGGIIWMFLAIEILGISYDWHKIQGDMFYSMLYLVIATTIFTLFLYQKSSQILGPKKLMAYIYLSPAFVALISYLSKGITISFGVIVGISISLLATIIILKEDKI